MDVVKVQYEPSLWNPFEKKLTSPNFYAHLVEQEGNKGLFQTVPSQTFDVKKYSKLKGVLNPYTWGLNVESDLTQATVGISSKDILSTTAIDLGYVFDINERNGSWKAQLSYQA